MISLKRAVAMVLIVFSINRTDVLARNIYSWSGHEISHGWKSERYTKLRTPVVYNTKRKSPLMEFIRGHRDEHAQMIVSLETINIDDEVEYSTSNPSTKMDENSREILIVPIIEKIEVPDSWEPSGDYSSGLMKW